MLSFLQSRNPRERLLLLVSLGLFVLFLGWLLVWRPVTAYQARSLAAEQSAARDFEIVSAGLPQLTGNIDSSGRQPFDRNAVFNTARNAQINISRVQPENDGALKVWFDNTHSQNLFGFLSTLTEQYSVDITQTQINRSGDGNIGAQITFQVAGGNNG